MRTMVGGVPQLCQTRSVAGTISLQLRLERREIGGEWAQVTDVSPSTIFNDMGKMRGINNDELFGSDVD